MKGLRIIIYTAFVLSTTIATTQGLSGKASYSIKLAEDDFFFNGLLDFTVNESLFKTKQKNNKKWIREDENEYNFQIIYTDTIGHIVHRQFAKPYLMIRSFCQIGKPVVYKDSISFNWILTQDEMNIKGIACKKARTTFRGREYEAWYAPSIASSAGPWKFFGLPGLILQVSESQNQILIELKSLKIKTHQDVLEKTLEGNLVRRSEFNQCLDSEWKKYYQKNQANIAQLQAEFPDLEISDNNLSEKRPATELEN